MTRSQFCQTPPRAGRPRAGVKTAPRPAEVLPVIPGASWWRSPRATLMLVLTLVAAAGAPSLQNQFVTDDRNLFVYRDNQRAHRLGEIWSQGSLAAMQGDHPLGAEGLVRQADTYRPLTLTSFVADRELWGQSPVGFHLTSLLLHLGACVLAFFWLRRVVGTPLAAAGTTFLGIHPATAEAWVWINGRADLLIAIGVLSALLALERRRPVLAAVAFLAACLCKETALCALPLLAMRPRFVTDPVSTPPLAWRPRSALVPLAAAAVVYLGARAIALEGARLGTAGGALAALARRGPALILEGLAELVVPHHLALRPTREDLDALATFPRLLAALVVLIALTLAYRSRHRHPALLWGLAGAALLLLPASLGVSFGGGRYLYLPLVLLLPGLLPPLATALWRTFWRRPLGTRRALGTALLAGYAAALLLALLTVERLYRNEVTLFEATAAQYPHRALGWGGLGLAYLDMGAPAQARTHLERALTILPDRRSWREAHAEASRQLNAPAATTTPARTATTATIPVPPRPSP